MNRAADAVHRDAAPGPPTMRDPLLHRRTILRGLGAAVALPWMEAMLPRGVGRAASAAALTGPLAPARITRVAYLFFPNGVNPEAWTPAPDGKGGWTPSSILEPLADLRREITVYRGLRLQNAEARGDGPGDHARSAACFLTGVHPVKTAGSDISAGESIDQAIAARLSAGGARTRLASLELGSEPAMTAGNCDSGYSCAYSANISWRSQSLPNGKETDPQAAFERVFGKRDESPEDAARRLRSRRSILDGVVREAKAIAREVGAGDRARLDEYLEGVRGLERRIADDAVATLDAGDIPEDLAGGPVDLARRVDLLGEVLALAFKTDSTRVATLMLANEGSNRPYREIGVSEGHHDVSHHGKDAAKLDAFARINRHHAERLAAFLRALARIEEDGRPLLDSTIVLYGGAIGDGNRHNHDDLPILVAGGRARGLDHGGRNGRLAALPPSTPLCDLHVGIARTMGVELPYFGDSLGVVTP